MTAGNRARRPAAALIAILAVAAAGASPAQDRPPSPGASGHFYNPDREVRVEGRVDRAVIEPRYENRASFLILIVTEKKSGRKYSFELSPVWFFGHDFHGGEPVTVVGSVFGREGDVELAIARQVRAGGETLVLRDEHGFPNWRGGPGGARGRRRGKDL